MQTPDTQSEIDRLAACGPLRTWSVIVTVLGDFCRSRDQRVGGRELQAVLGRIGLTPASTRVALHRLRRDGWIESERRGRDAAYRLSAMGWRETEAARGRIYATAPPVGTVVHLVLAPPHMAAPDFAAVLPPEAVQIAPRTALLAGAAKTPASGFWTARLEAGAAPRWLAEAVAGPDLREGYARLIEAANAALDAPVPADAVARAALRVLILHHWRRLRLRHGDLPDSLLGEDWEGARARRAVMSALTRFEHPAPGELG
ncbi:MAG: hypothetical protein M5U35_09785 [Roseovarius sp.]|nr:hypothetical protein [Roseovarius sp.]